MPKSKTRSKRAARSKPKNSSYADLALRALRRAQRNAARENARFGLPLIVVPSR
jgi:hypothetical protein